jgi:hypothetical protein
MPLENRTALVVVHRTDGVPTAKIMGDADPVVDGFRWADSERRVVSMPEKYGSRDAPLARRHLQVQCR